MVTENNLFSAKDMYAVEHTSTGRAYELIAKSCKERYRKIHENMHLMDGMAFTPNLQYPMMKPYNGSTDFVGVSYKERNKHNGNGEALHFFLDDYAFRDAVWFNLERTTNSIYKYDYVFTPDLSHRKDLPTDFYNRENVFRTRFVGAYWQKCGYNVIPTASWGDLSSFEYCFEGLPVHSVIAVSGMGNRKCNDAFDRWCYGLRRLEEAKAPTLIIVYGEDVKVPGLHAPLKFIPCFIQKRFRKQ